MQKYVEINMMKMHLSYKCLTIIIISLQIISYRKMDFMSNKTSNIS